MPYTNISLPPEHLPEDLSDPDEEFLCPDPEVRERCLHGYLSHALSDRERREFEAHLGLCFKCREDVDYFRWTARQIRNVQRISAEPALSPEALYDFAGTDLLPYYNDRPLTEQLAAASGRVGRVGFPVTVEYLQGQVVGEFRKRAGYLFFHLKRSTVGAQQVACALVFSAERDPGGERAFELQEGDEKRLGPLRDFAASDTIQDITQALKRFRLVVTPPL